MMISRVAIPVFDGMLSYDFGHYSHFEVFDIKDGSVVRHHVERPYSNSQTGFLVWVSDMEITDFVADGIDLCMLSVLCREKVNLFVGVDCEPVDVLVDRYINGRLRSNIDAIMGSIKP